MTSIEAQEVEVVEEMIKGMLVWKPQDEYAIKREQNTLNISRGGKKNYNPNKRNVECYYYNKFGHYASECWKK